ncbi:metal ABC transporter permease [Pseudoglutamicibacter albus]|uniref:Metal ABC transporter permease n=1 Tax=Pseudoglutamicibacter cumminsii TaxID=156979 RepID=A0AAP4C6A7_9MICC|nr:MULTISPECIES: metal ABC transporter permease [Pseudoglutamicibacter]MBM7795964.1 manganese/zinc/iron transport system permease protein [Pseudoglutamicibacter cumminsii]MCT1685341.1 metal ABC transporter permease [Pseudoglutamicibacter cumminsii]MDK6274577.1 metal ABC transporter permease [Pseudoglutamicibacter cumminsii]MDK7083920.1 metal ABC transporter permease [Pseudoglutamicibacter cumminsii]MDZ3744750.1 metal ABC transporter permease [Pseudoglutamicibacter cumminsii]
MSLIEFFSNHTYRMVFFGTMTIGLVAGALGSFAYLRKQSLISDVISHAALPGTLLAFLTAVGVLGTDGRNMIGLILGAVIVGTIAVLFANGISLTSKIRIDTAMAISLTVFFGGGMLLMRIIANGAYPGKGGIQDYLFGNASVITVADLATSITIGVIVVALMLVFWKEFTLRSFDPDHSTVLGFRARTIDTLMFVTIVIATVIGVKAVGLVLMVAFVVTPPAAARQWTRTLPSMVALSAVIGGVGSGVGAYLSIVLGKVPTGPLIVLTLFAIFLVSLLFAPRRSIITRAVSRARARAHLKRELLHEGNLHEGSRP